MAVGRTCQCLGLVFSVLVLAPAVSHAAWNQPVGGTSPINQAANQNASDASLASIGGIPYVAWTESDGTNREIRVSRLNQAGTAWEQVVGGANPINHATDREARDPSLVSIGGTPYVAWLEFDGTNTEVRVSRLNQAGTAWEQVVGGASPINQAANQNAFNTSLASIGGIPYVAWTEFDGTNVEVRVSRLNEAGTAWDQVVGGASPINHAAGNDASDPSLTSIGGTPYVAWREHDGANWEVRVSRLNQAATAWEQVVGGASPINQAANQNAFNASLVSIGGIPYVAWLETDGTNWRVRVSRLNQAGTAWEQLVGGASPINHAEDRDGVGPSLTSIGGIPYVAWSEFDGTNWEVRVSRLNQAGTAWEQVVGGASPINQAANQNVFNTSLASIGGIPYVAWTESDGTNIELRVSRLEPELSQPEVLPTDTGAVLLSRVRGYGVPYPVVFEYGPGSALGSRTAVTMSSSDQGTDTVFKTIGGLSPATAYSFRAVGFDGTYSIAPSTTVQFTTNAQSGPGPAGPAGPAGLPGSTTPGQPAVRLLVAVVNTRLKAKVGRRVTLQYLSTRTGKATLEVFKGRRRIARTTGSAKVGRNKIAWNGKRGRKKATAGRYTLKLSVTAGDGQVATGRGTVTLRR